MKQPTPIDELIQWDPDFTADLLACKDYTDPEDLRNYEQEIINMVHTSGCLPTREIF